MDALIFDFDGVVVDSEPMHLAGFQQVLQSVGIEMSADEYYTKYLGYDDHDCLKIASEDKGRPLGEKQIAELTEKKTRLVQQMIRESIKPLPGSVELIRAAHDAGIPLAICSGALGDEVRLASDCIGVLECFQVITPAEDVTAGKPDPEGYRLTLERLRKYHAQPLEPQRCVVVEDSPAGIQSARSAGMNVLAVETSYPPDALQAAARIVHRLTDVTLEDVKELASGEE
ncbi:MAG: HAD family hydrolase [Phycisphaerae bacterium]